MSQAAPATMGHNSGDVYEEARTDAQAYQKKLIEVGDKWISAEDRKEITDEKTANNLKGFLDQCQKWEADAEKKRKAEKQPHLDAGRAVDSWFADLKTPVNEIVKTLKPRLAAYLKREEAKRRAAEEAARKEAEQKARELAEAQRKAAESNTPTADAEALRRQEEEARQKAAEAEALAKKKTQVKSDFGKATGLRSNWSAEITDYDAALAHFKNTAEVRGAVEKLAAALARNPAGRQTEVPGVKFVEEKVL